MCTVAYWSGLSHLCDGLLPSTIRGVYPKGVERAISHIFKMGSLIESSFGLHNFDRLLLVLHSAS